MTSHDLTAHIPCAAQLPSIPSRDRSHPPSGSWAQPRSLAMDFISMTFQHLGRLIQWLSTSGKAEFQIPRLSGICVHPVLSKQPLCNCPVCSASVRYKKGIKGTSASKHHSASHISVTCRCSKWHGRGNGSGSGCRTNNLANKNFYVHIISIFVNANRFWRKLVKLVPPDVRF